MGCGPQNVTWGRSSLSAAIHLRHAQRLCQELYQPSITLPSPLVSSHSSHTAPPGQTPYRLTTRHAQVTSPARSPGPMSPLSGSSPVRRPPFLARTTSSFDPSVSTASDGEGSSSHSIGTAPTPFNTYFAPSEYAEDTRSLPGRLAAEDEEDDGYGVMYTPLKGDPSVSVQQTLSSPSTATPTASRVDSWYSSGSHANSHLLSPSPVRLRSAESPLPLSKKPIPAPPQTIRSPKPSQTVSLTRSSGIVSSPAHSPLIKVSSDGMNAKQVSFAASDESGTSDLPSLPKDPVGEGVRTEDVDAARLQQLGYDAVFGREYNFWSSLCITMCNIGFTQGTVLAAAGALTYGGPLMVVCLGIATLN